jgi:ribosomal protein L37E
MLVTTHAIASHTGKRGVTMAIIRCRECAHQVSDQAASCPSCGAPITPNIKSRSRARQRVMKVLVTLMTVWTLGTLLWLIPPSWARDELITGARWTLQRLNRNIEQVPTSDHRNATTESQRPQANTNAPLPTVPDATQPALALRSVYRTTAEELYRDYEANAVATQTRIGTSLVRLNGSIAEIDQDTAGRPVVKLWTGKDSAAAMTLGENQRAAAAQLYKGEAVDIECDKIGGGDAVLQGSDCTLVFVDIRTREVNLALFLTNESGAAHVYVVGPMPEAVCRAHSDEISSRLRGKQRNEHLVWRSCTEAGRESILAGGCHLNSPEVTLPDVPTAHLWRYECGSSRVARTTLHKSTSDSSRGDSELLATTGGPATMEPATQPAAQANAAPGTAPAALASSVEAGTAAGSAPQATARPTSNDIRFASAGGADIGAPTAATAMPAQEVTVAHAPPPGRNENAVSFQGGSPETGSPQTSATPDDLAQVRAVDPQAADHISDYCSKAIASPNRADLLADCRRTETEAWTRLVLQNEFPTLDDATRQKCSEPPFPDTYVAKEACARYELHAN